MTSHAASTARYRWAEESPSPVCWLSNVAPGHAPGSPPWWRAVQCLGTPLRGAVHASGTELLFLWREPGAVQTVYVDVDGHTPHPTQGPAAMQHLPGTDVWFWQTRLPGDWLGSYAFLPVPPNHPPLPPTARERRSWWMSLSASSSQADDFNHLPSAADGWGRPRAWLRPSNKSLSVQPPPGHTQHWPWHSDRLARQRSVWLHSTRGATPTSPWVLLLDGQAWAQHLPLFPRLDAATAQGTLPAAHYLAIDACDPDTRWLELGCHAPFWQAVIEELLPEAAVKAGVGAAPPCVVAGQSLGGLSALYAALHWPDSFPAALSQSSSFWWPDPADGTEHAQLINQVSGGLFADAPLRALLQYGERDATDMRALSQQMASALGPARAQTDEIAGGHDWVCWREALIPGLQRLLAHPLAKEPP